MRYFADNLPVFSGSVFLAVGLLLLPLKIQAATPDCHITQGTPVIDYGRLAPASGNPSQTTLTLSERTVTVTVNCTLPKRVALLFDGDGLPGQDFRFGERGTVRVSVSSGTVDGRRIPLARWNKDTRSEDRLTVLTGDGIVWKDGALAVSGTLFSVVIGVEPTVSAHALRSRDITSLEGRIRLRLETD